MYKTKKIYLKTVIISNLKKYLQLKAASLRRLQKTITCKCLERLPRRLKPNDSTSIIELKANVSAPCFLTKRNVASKMLSSRYVFANGVLCFNDCKIFKNALENSTNEVKEFTLRSKKLFPLALD